MHLVQAVAVGYFRSHCALSVRLKCLQQKARQVVPLISLISQLINIGHVEKPAWSYTWTNGRNARETPANTSVCGLSSSQ